MSRYTELKKMSELISEVHLCDNGLYAFVSDYNICEFLKCIEKHVFDDDGIDAVLKEGYIVIPDFQEVLEAQFDMSLEEAKEYFNL